MSLSREFSEMIQEQNNSYRFIHPLVSGMEFLPIEKQQSRWMQEFTALQEMAARHKWKNLPELFEALHDPEVAIVITDPKEQIQWVSEGFFRMTGFRAEEALNRKPSFLQGPETDQEAASRMRRALDNKQPTEGTLLNYRKNGEPYLCNVAITPLFNQEDSLINFIAVEKEVPA